MDNNPITLADAGALAAILHAVDTGATVARVNLATRQAVTGQARYIGRIDRQPVDGRDVRDLFLFIRTSDGQTRKWLIRTLLREYPSGQFMPDFDLPAFEAAGGHAAVPGAIAEWLAANQTGTLERQAAAELRERELVREARRWIADNHPDVDVAGLDDFQVREGMETGHPGGWDGFARNADASRMDNPEPPAAYPAMVYVYDGDGELTDAGLVLSQDSWAALCAVQPAGYQVLTANPVRTRDRL